MRWMVMAAALLVACGGDDDGSDPGRCASATDCAAGERCVNGFCTPGDSDAAVDAGDDAGGGTDAGGDDAGGADTGTEDAGVDAATSCAVGGCGDGAYCAADDCDGEGMCTARPEACPDIFAPVCGCDGATYGNDCEAAAAGVRVASEGECTSAGCRSNGECGRSQYCAGDSCAEVGTCEVRPTVCPRIIDPVCGCDGSTYDNDCLAALAGVRVASTGACRTTGTCTTNDMCPSREYCAGDGCGTVGTCVIRPEFCIDLFDPVCGCDGRQYSNSCFAGSAGVRVDPDSGSRCIAF